MNPKVDWFFNEATKWQDAYAKLRSLLLDSGLTEELKWGCPCYTFQNRNIVLVQGFKDYCALLFVKGALLKDREGILVQQTVNVQASRQIRFTDAQDIVNIESILKEYFKEAIDIEKAGLKVELKPTSEFNMPEEFKMVLEDMPGLKTAFMALTPGRQRAYLLYFSAPKQSKTREARVEKCIRKILNGKGLDD
jgi:uncharacterized protein YdeI (YjbR/CyaY-like superfamily)